MYLRWQRLLPAWIRITPLELPGRGSRIGENFVVDYDSLLTKLSSEIVPHTEKNWALFGHSMGALVAHGLLRYLHSHHLNLPKVLFASGSPAPARRDPDRYVGLTTDEALIADLRKQGGTPEDVFNHPELLRMTLDTLAADYQVCASFNYQSNAPLPIPIHALGGQRDDIESWRLEAWRMETAASFSLQWFDGGHFFIREQEPQVLQAITKTLQQIAINKRVDTIAG